MKSEMLSNRQTDRQTHRPSTVTVTAHARRGLIKGEAMQCQVSVILTSSQWGFQSVPGGPAEVHSRSGIGPHYSLLLELDYGTGLSLLRYSTLAKETEDRE